jgi:uncharacterized protein YdaU (DUF1376 family)
MQRDPVLNMFFSENDEKIACLRLDHALFGENGQFLSTML